MSYRLSLILNICALVVATGAGLTGFGLYRASQNSMADARDLFHQITTTAVVQTTDHVQHAEPLALSLAALARHGLRTEDSTALAVQLLPVLKANRGVTWISYSDSNGTFTGIYRKAVGQFRVNQSWTPREPAKGSGWVMEYDVQPDGSWKNSRNEATNYDPRARPFYQRVAQTGEMSWVGPYLFYDQGVPGVTCAAPVRNNDGTLRGVVTVDFDLTMLSHFVAGALNLDHSRVIIITSDGVVLADPAATIDFRLRAGAEGELPKVGDVHDPLAAALFDAIPAPVRSEMDDQNQVGNFHVLSLMFNGQRYFAAATTFRVDDQLSWIVAAAAPQSDFLANAYRDAATAGIVAALAVLVAVILGIAMARRVSGPIVSLVAFMRRVGAGELTEPANLHGGREFVELSAALTMMIQHLRDRLRILHSLSVAQEVQQRLLPQSPPTINGLDLAGHSTYCDETGGDYYDFLTLERDPFRVLVAVGDVMGHGVGAALPMAGSRAILRSRATSGGTLAGILAEMNQQLEPDLRGQGFITMLLAIVDSRRGFVRWASAGHDPIMLFDPLKCRFEELVGADLPLAVEADANYTEFCREGLRPGEVLLLGTDGVWEAANESGEMFGKDRLRDAISNSALRPAAEIRDNIAREIEKFRGGCPQRDDITFVVVKVTQVFS